MTRTFRSVGVIGLGTMGAGIAEVLAGAGVDVIGVEADAAAAARGREHLQRSTDRAVRRRTLTADDRTALLTRITVAVDLAAVADCELVIEAVPERLEAKTATFRALDGLVDPATILATNTSALSVTEIAVATARPGRVVGMHWFNPAPLMGLVEVVGTVAAEPAVVADVVELARRAGKSPVLVGDRAGFVANALLFGYLANALRRYEARYATREDIDAAMRTGCGHPMGPLALLDLIGLDTALEILETMYRQSRDHLHAPPPLLRQLVVAGRLGRKTGRGIYAYDGPGSARVVADTASDTATGATADPDRPDDAGPSLRPVSTVGVVGGGPLAAALARELAAAGCTMVSVTDLGDLAAAELVIDTTAEDPAAVVTPAALAAHSAPGAILATTAGTVTAFARETGRPADVVGVHWAETPGSDPAAFTRLVEIVPTLDTAADVVATVRSVCERARKVTVLCPDRAGRLVDALLLPYLNDAARMVDAGYASADDIDTAMTLGCGHPRGPFALLDDLGLDVVLAGQRALFEESREPGLAPAVALGQLVAAGHLGASTGRGFRDHPAR